MHNITPIVCQPTKNISIQKDIEEIESLSSIVGAMIKQRNDLGISQRELSAMCGIPQSSVARIV